MSGQPSRIILIRLLLTLINSRLYNAPLYIIIIVGIKISIGRMSRAIISDQFDYLFKLVVIGGDVHDVFRFGGR